MIMKTSSKQALIEIADRVVELFAEEWKVSPYLWLQEIDVQVELVARIKSSVANAFPDLSYLKGSISIRVNGDSKEQMFSRITCEPYVKPPGGGYRILPDIVIWDDGNGESQYINDGDWPIIWACEIKYKTTDYGLSDFNRLKGLVEGQPRRAEKGHLLSLCWNESGKPCESFDETIRLKVTKAMPVLQGDRMKP
jgi:hypothetical protein